MKVLIISHKPPYPINDGGSLAMSRLLIDILSLDEIESVNYHTLATHKHPFESSAFLKHPKLKISGHQIDTRIKPMAALIALIKQESYNLKRFYDNKVLGTLQKELSIQAYDIVIFESLFAAVYAAPLSNFTKAKFIYRAHNIEYRIWKDLANNTKNVFKKWYLQQLAYALKWAERTIWSEDLGKLDLILAISHEDLQQIEAETLSTCRYLPSSIEISAVKSNLAPLKLCFLGAFNWNPNIEAVEWFLNKVFPQLKRAYPALEFHIAGKGSEAFRDWQLPGVHIHGFVPDACAFIAEHGIFVGCLQSGSGVKMKILEAMSAGAPIVLSQKSADGLPMLDPTLIHDNLEDFKNDLISLLSSPQALLERSSYFSTYFSRHFNATNVQKQLKMHLKELQNNK